MKSVPATGLALFVLMSLGALAASCGGLSPEEAAGYCDRARQAEPQCINDAAYAQCKTCYEDCGVNCVAAESCPKSFVCD